MLFLDGIIFLTLAWYVYILGLNCWTCENPSFLFLFILCIPSNNNDNVAGVVSRDKACAPLLISGGTATSCMPLCRPMREWPVPTVQGTDEVGGWKSRAVFAASALLFSFLVTFHIRFHNSFFHCPSPAGTITGSDFPIIWINFACFEVTFASVHERQSGEPDFPDSCCQLTV